MGVAIVIMVVALVLAFVGLLIYMQHLAEKKRTEQLGPVAEQLGFDFSPQGDPALLESLKPFRLFSQGHSEKLWNLMRGHTHDLDVAIFDYRYVTGGGKHSHTWLHTVVCFRFDGEPLPSFALRPENLFHKIGALFGYQDIDFKSHSTFSKNYLLRGEDEAAIREVFTPDLLDFYAEQTGICTEGSGNVLLVYREKRAEPSKIGDFMEEGFGVYSAFRPVGDA